MWSLVNEMLGCSLNTQSDEYDDAKTDDKSCDLPYEVRVLAGEEGAADKLDRQLMYPYPIGQTQAMPQKNDAKAPRIYVDSYELIGKDTFGIKAYINDQRFCSIIKIDLYDGRLNGFDVTGYRSAEEVFAAQEPHYIYRGKILPESTESGGMIMINSQSVELILRVFIREKGFNV